MKFFKLSILIFLLMFIPFSAFATTCSEAGGSCMLASDCEAGAMASSLYDEDCDETDSSICCNYQEGSTGGFLLLKGHIVPCGRSTDDIGTPGDGYDETASCTLCHLFIMLKNIFDLMLSLFIVASILFITIGGVVYIVSTGNPNLTGMAKKIIKNTLIGFALMLGGWLLVFTLLTFLSSQGMVGNGNDTWYQFDCKTDSKF